MTDSGTKVLEERVAALTDRVAGIEAKQDVQGMAQTQLLVEIKVLQTRVTLYAAGVAAVVSIAVKYLL